MIDFKLIRRIFILTAAIVLPAGCSHKELYDNFPLKELVKTEINPVSIENCAGDAVLIDFGKDAFSQIELTLDSPDDRQITVHLGEAVKEGRVDREPGASIRYAAYPLDIAEGRHTYQIEFRADPRNTTTTPVGSGAVPVLMPEEIGEVYPFRYCELENFTGSVIREETEQIRVHYPFNDDNSFFESSDDVLNQVWDICKYSIKATSFCGYYVDGDRERIPYEADALINQLSHYCVDSEYAMARRSVAYLMENPTWPTEWQLEMVLTAWYDYLYTGDKALLEKYYDVIKAKTLVDLTAENGLISTETGLVTPEVKAAINYHGTDPIKDIVDWPRSGSFGIDKLEAGEADGYDMTSYNTVVNALHNGSLQYMARIAAALGNRQDEKFFLEKAATHRKAFNSLLFDKTRGIYRDGLESGHHSLHANMFPLLFGLVPEGYGQTVTDFIHSRGMACSVYGAQFLLDALYRVGDDDYALSLMNSTSRRSWYNMIRCGSTITMEAWDPVFKSNLDWNHAWGAAPANIIMRHLVGVEPLKPGFKTVRIAPQPGGLDYFNALVPSPAGGIRCEYHKGQSFALMLPDGVDAEVRLPLNGGGGAVTKVTRNGNAVSFKDDNGIVSFRVKGGAEVLVCTD